MSSNTSSVQWIRWCDDLLLSRSRGWSIEPWCRGETEEVTNLTCIICGVLVTWSSVSDGTSREDAGEARDGRDESWIRTNCTLCSRTEATTSSLPLLDDLTVSVSRREGTLLKLPYPAWKDEATTDMNLQNVSINSP